MFIGDIVKVNKYYHGFSGIIGREGIVLDLHRSGSGKRRYTVSFLSGGWCFDINDVELDVVHSIHDEKKR